MSPSDAPLGPSSARCATHPEAEASGTCARCGTFYCASCVRHVFGKDLCATCAERPEIHYLERFRLELWGRRDSWGWSVGLGGLVLAGLGARMLWVQPGWMLAVSLGLSVSTAVAFFLGLRWARELLLVAPLLSAGLCWLGQRMGMSMVFVMLFFSAFSIYFDTRNQLFFRRPVSPERLQKLWHLRKNNPMARNALSLGLGGIFFPLFAPFAILCGVVGLRRVDPQAMPPIGRKTEAIAGLVLGVGSLVLWGAVLWARFADNGGF